MLAIERKDAILARLSEEGKVIVSELAKEYNVTEETIRRDIDRLVKDGLATKTYGGAVSASGSSKTDLPYQVRKSTNVERKETIAELIAGMISDGDRIMLDASSTVVCLVRKLKNKKNLTVITNSVEILLELSDVPGWTVLSTGGTLKEGALSLVGSSAEKMIRGYHVDWAVCSAKGVDGTMGITESSERDAEIKQVIFAAADRKVLAVDATKFDRISIVKVCDLCTVDTIVTDERPSDEWLKRLSDEKIDIVYHQ